MIGQLALFVLSFVKMDYNENVQINVATILPLGGNISGATID